MHGIKLAENCSSDCFDSIAYSILKYRSLDYEAYNIKYFYTNYFCAENNCLIRGENAGCSVLVWETEDGKRLWGRNFDLTGPPREAK